MNVWGTFHFNVMGTLHGNVFYGLGGTFWEHSGNVKLLAGEQQPQQHTQHNNPVQLVPPRTRAPLPPGDVHNDDDDGGGVHFLALQSFNIHYTTASTLPLPHIPILGQAAFDKKIGGEQGSDERVVGVKNVIFWREVAEKKIVVKRWGKIGVQTPSHPHPTPCICIPICIPLHL